MQRPTHAFVSWSVSRITSGLLTALLQDVWVSSYKQTDCF